MYVSVCVRMCCFLYPVLSLYLFLTVAVGRFWSMTVVVAVAVPSGQNLFEHT